MIIVSSTPLYGLSEPSEEQYSQIIIDSVPLTDSGDGVDATTVVVFTLLAASAIGLVISVAISAKKRESEDR